MASTAVSQKIAHFEQLGSQGKASSSSSRVSGGLSGRVEHLPVMQMGKFMLEKGVSVGPVAAFIETVGSEQEGVLTKNSRHISFKFQHKNGNSVRVEPIVDAELRGIATKLFGRDHYPVAFVTVNGSMKVAAYHYSSDAIVWKNVKQ